MRKIFSILGVIILLLIMGWLIPIKTETVQGCPGADHVVERHNLILGDTLPKIDGSPMIECVATITHKLYLL
jgi:hypothetical protein